MPENNGFHVASSSPIRAVILDYGEVLCHRPTPQDIHRMADVFHLDREAFPSIYAHSRNPYDQGTISMEDYWSNFAKNAGVELDGDLAKKVQLWDIQMWSNINATMTGWLKAIHTSGLRTAILSNMTHPMKAYMLENYEWLRYFDCHVFSCDIKVIKPDAAIYRHCLECLGTTPEATLFIDDREANIEGAKAVGIQAIHFQSVEQLRGDLEAIKFPILPELALSL